MPSCAAHRLYLRRLLHGSHLDVVLLGQFLGLLGGRRVAASRRRLARRGRLGRRWRVLPLGSALDRLLPGLWMPKLTRHQVGPTGDDSRFSALAAPRSLAQANSVNRSVAATPTPASTQGSTLNQSTVDEDASIVHVSALRVAGATKSSEQTTAFDNCAVYNKSSLQWKKTHKFNRLNSNEYKLGH